MGRRDERSCSVFFKVFLTVVLPVREHGEAMQFLKSLLLIT
jgi:hypothetical protein